MHPDRVTRRGFLKQAGWAGAGLAACPGAFAFFRAGTEYAGSPARCSSSGQITAVSDGGSDDSDSGDEAAGHAVFAAGRGRQYGGADGSGWEAADRFKRGDSGHTVERCAAATCAASDEAADQHALALRSHGWQCCAA